MNMGPFLKDYRAAHARTGMNTFKPSLPATGAPASTGHSEVLCVSVAIVPLLTVTTNTPFCFQMKNSGICTLHAEFSM
jgi:hypothetical protein